MAVIEKLHNGRSVEAPCTPGHMGHPANCETAKPNRWGVPVHREAAPQYEVFAAKGEVFSGSRVHSELVYNMKEARESAVQATEPCGDEECDICHPFEQDDSNAAYV